MPSTDVESYNQVFLRKEYEFGIKRTPRTIVDAGANIGLASVFFANKFPDAKVYGIEPEEGNFGLLRKNLASYGNVTCMQGAVWHENENIDLVDPGLGSWGFMTAAQEDADPPIGEVIHKVPGMTIDSIMDKFDIEHIDLLKMDIEGAEREVFRDPDAWIGKVDALIIELHERMKPGSTRSFYRGTDGFDYEWLQGENIFLVRKESCILRR